MIEKIQVNQSNAQTVKVVPIMASLLICGFMGMFSETSLNMALSGLIKEFNISPATAQWVTTSYLLVLGILIPVSGIFIRRFRTKKIFIMGITFFILGLVIAATSSTFKVLLVGRIIQATGTGLLTPLLFNTVLVIFPPQKRGTAMGIVSLVMMFAPATGPIISGLVIQYFNWHLIFLIPIPLLMISLLLGLGHLIDLSREQKPRIDLISIVLSSLGFGGLVFGFSHAGEADVGWMSWEVLGSLLIGILAMIFFVLRQMTIKEPILNVRVFKQPMFVLGISLTVLSNMIIFSSNLLLPMYMQGGLGFSSAQAGLLLLPGGILNGIMAFINGRIFDKYGPRWLVIPGFMMGTIATLVFAHISSTTHSLTIIIFYTILMIGMSMITTPSQSNGLNQLDRSLYPDGSAIINTTIQTSGAIGTAIAVSILNANQHASLNQIREPLTSTLQVKSLIFGIQHAYLFTTIVAVIGLFCSLLIKRVLVEKVQQTIH
ncbi:DHA2 family efflux MFS transporter permease subunit [Lysinibacillus xylanilyticus]|uniref:DHA2 family efflux MFS transporter permease subunit n=1 Tax=Lysinibacillus xylanilyticus TaxID=582475 RepID=UPI003D014FC0